MAGRRQVLRDFAWLLGALAAILAWDASGWDRAVSHWFGGQAGFRWRDAWLASALAHDGGRWLGIGLLVLLAADACRPLVPGPARRERVLWWVVMLASALAVPGLKRASLTSCPWDLAEFGGSAAYVPHWLPGVADGGPGHCFPSGHAVSAFALLGIAFLWRPHRPRAAKRLLATVLLLGTVYGAAQTVRGAHFVSHTLWSGWFCALIATVMSAALQLSPPGRAGVARLAAQRSSAAASGLRRHT